MASRSAAETYKMIQYWVTKRLHHNQHERHLEDCIQHVAMEFFAHGEQGQFEWYFCNYCRSNGLNSGLKSKQAARTLEVAISIDAPTPGESEGERSDYLLDQESISRSAQEERLISMDDSFRGALEEFLLPLGLSNEVMRWATKSYRVKMN